MMKSNDFKREELRDFITRVEYQKKSEEINYASGVIVKTNSSAYILTVKHTFKKRDNQTLSSVEFPDLNLVNVYDYYRNRIPINEVIFLENKELDIALFKIDDKFKEIEKIKTLKLYMGEFNFCAIAGYPKGRRDNQSVIIQASNPDEIEKDFFSKQLRPENTIVSFSKSEMDNLKGLSGGGVFKRGGSGKIYLIGIQYEYAGYMDYLKVLDIRTIIHEIEAKIDEELLIGKYPFFEKLGIDASKLNFESLENNFKINKDIQKIRKSSNEYQFLLENNRENKNLEKLYLSLKKDMKRLADIYCYHGKVFFDNHDKIRAFNAFSRAMELYPEYKRYFLKDEFRDISLTKEQENHREEIDEEIRTFSNSDITEIILEDNIDNSIKKNKYDSLESNIGKLISFLSKNFNKNRKKINRQLMELSKVKLKNGKAMEAEKILLNIRDEFDDGELNDEVNNLLIETYNMLIALENSSVTSSELRLKLEKLLILFRDTDKQYLIIQNMIVHVSKERYLTDDCFIEHLASQRRKIEVLKDENYKLHLKNKACYNKIYHQQNLLIKSIQQNRIKIFLDSYCKTRFVILAIIGTVFSVLWFMSQQ